MPTIKTVSPDIWYTLQGLWSSGRFSTLGALHREGVKLFADKCPGIQTIRNYADRNMWINDDAMQESIEAEKKKTANQILSELGMSLTRRLELLSEMIIAPHEDYDRIRSLLDKLFKGDGSNTDEKTIAGALKDLRMLYSKGMELSLKALTLAGHYAGDINRAAAAAPASGNADPQNLLDMTPEETTAEIDRIIKSMAQKYVENKTVAPAGE